jgi:ATP-dependent Clp protease adaptor protein ClpS
MPACHASATCRLLFGIALTRLRRIADARATAPLGGAPRRSRQANMTTTIIDRSSKAVHVRPPPLWRVIFHDDDFTPIGFVAEVLMRRYGKSEEEAWAITMDVHHKGMGIAGVYPKEIAEQKAITTSRLAQANGYPLLADTQQDL